MQKKILTVLSEWGYWGEELVGPLDVFNESGIAYDFWTPTGRIPRALPPSMSATYVDPPLGRSVTTPEMAAKVKQIDDRAGEFFSGVVSLAERFSLRPYMSEMFQEGNERAVVPGHLPVLRELEDYYLRRSQAQAKVVEDYDAILLVGGSGPMVDMVNNRRLHDLILGFYFADKPIAAECYGVACLAQAREFDDCRSIIWGKHVTGHAKELDYTDQTGVLDPETHDILVNRNGTFVNLGPPFYTLEFILRDAVGPDGQFHGNFGRPTSVLVDYPFITGRSTPDSYLTGEKLVQVLNSGLRRFGW
ncbi:MAG TPA: type 1 glutamine amidotransferase domain-containing protein [Terrimicrobiaceae bacterium]